MLPFTSLDIWNVGLSLVREVYTITKKFPSDERYEMTSQIRKASTSILANYAEGYSRWTDADKAHKYTIARGECSEVKAFLLMSVDLHFVKYADVKKALQLAEKVGQLLSGLHRAYQTHNPNPHANPNPKLTPRPSSNANVS
jgi:four helix bundle protein